VSAEQEFCGKPLHVGNTSDRVAEAERVWLSVFSGASRGAAGSSSSIIKAPSTTILRRPDSPSIHLFAPVFRSSYIVPKQRVRLVNYQPRPVTMLAPPDAAKHAAMQPGNMLVARWRMARADIGAIPVWQREKAGRLRDI
jgi:hypothetical protein